MSHNHDALFWGKVNKTSETGCWLWTGATSMGYGKLRRYPKTLWAHRYAYEMLVGAIPDGLTLDHVCRVRRCVNPAHLMPSTHRENILRGTGMSARNAKKDVCIRGHKFDYVHPIKGWRRCKTCRRELDAIRVAC